MDTYKIIIKGLPSHHITDLFADLTITPLENGEVQLIVPMIDQAALRGLIDYLWDFNTTVLAVERIEEK